MFRPLSFTHFITVFTIALTCHPLRVARADFVTLSTSEAVTYALARNQNLAAARLRIDEARGQLLGAGRLQNPELDVELRRNVRTSESSVQAQFMQRFPLTARLSLEKAVSKAQLAAAEAEVRDFERRLTADVRASAIKLLALKAKALVAERQLANSQDNAQFSAKRVGTGEASPLDVYQLEVDAKQIEVELRQIHVEQAVLNGELRALLGVKRGDDLALSGSLDPVPAAVEKQAGAASGEARPDLAAARHAAESAKKATELAKARKWEDISLGVVGSRERIEDAPQGLSNDHFLGLRLSVPLPLWNRNEGGIAQANATATRAGLAAEALATSIQNEIDTARSEMAALASLLAEMDSHLLPKATALQEALSKSYEGGQSPLTEVLRARSRRLDLEERRIDALRNYHLAKTRCQAALGFPAEVKH